MTYTLTHKSKNIVRRYKTFNRALQALKRLGGRWWTISTAALIVALASCAPTNPERWMERQINSCVPTAIAFRQGLRRQDVWAEVFAYRFTDPADGKSKGHAMTAYLYPPGANKLWTYDAEGSFRIRAYTNDLTSIARQSNIARGWGSATWGEEWIK